MIKNKGMRVGVFLFGLCLCAIVTGCNETEKIRALEKVVLLDVSFDKRMGQFSRNNRRRIKPPTGYLSQNKEEVFNPGQKAYFRRLSRLFYMELRKTPYFSLKIPENKGNKAGNKEVKNEKSHFTPMPFVATNTVFIQKNSPQLSNEYATDGVMKIEIEFFLDNMQEERWNKEADPFEPRQDPMRQTYWRTQVHQTQPTTLLMVVRILLFDKMGNTLLNKEIETEVKTETLEAVFSEVVRLNWDESELFQNIYQKFFGYLTESLEFMMHKEGM